MRYKIVKAACFQLLYFVEKYKRDLFLYFVSLLQKSTDLLTILKKELSILNKVHCKLLKRQKFFYNN